MCLYLRLRRKLRWRNKKIAALTSEVLFLDKVTDTQRKVIRHLDLIIKKRHSPKMFLTTIINNSKFIIMDLTLQVGDKKLLTPQLFDKVTGNQITDAVASNVVANSSDQTLFAVSENADGSVNLVAPPSNGGNGTVVVNANWSYTNSNGDKITGEAKAVTVNITVATPPPPPPPPVANETEMRLQVTDVV